MRAALHGVAVLFALVAALVLLLHPAPAWAHQSSVAYSHVDVTDDGRVTWSLQLSARDLYEALALDRDREATDDEILAGRARLLDYLTRRLRVADAATDASLACPLRPLDVELVHQTDRYARARLEARCPAPIRHLVLDYHLFFDLDAAHMGMLQVTHAGQTVARELTFAAPTFTWDLVGPAPESMHPSDFVITGIEHIFTGYDHICFLLGLLLVTGIRVRRAPDRAELEPRPARDAALMVLKTVTAFTFAHSLTLIAAALGWVSLPSRVVESAIAASIVFVAVENLLRPEPRQRWPLAFGFGLVHGLGFASVLRPMLPPSGIVPPLLCFNVGVELGQLAIVAVVLPVLVVAARRSARGYRRVVVIGGSILVGSFGLLWLVDRVFEVRTISRLLG
jgi:hypothetical protein